ncbi:MAG: HNH endonuclease [Crocinitomicaceae bacterium]|nr:HNH endonuclease [Crocinitomicaceae bacterium]
MTNRWGIPKEVEEQVRKRDLSCVYCRITFNNISYDHKTRPTWEHIINDIRINGPENIALCCGSCNASKGVKKLEDWLNSNYCSTKGITNNTVAQVVQDSLKNKK